MPDMAAELADLRKQIDRLTKAEKLLRKQVRELQQQARRPIWSQRGLTPVEMDE